MRNVGNGMFHGATPQLFAFAKQFREAVTPAELTLWESLRMNKLTGFRFEAQHPISYFLADFYYHSARLVVELDGSSHDSTEQQEYNANRTYTLEEFGLWVIRFRNEEVFSQINAVLETIASYLPKKLSPGITPALKRALLARQ